MDTKTESIKADVSQMPQEDGDTVVSIKAQPIIAEPPSYCHRVTSVLP